MFSKKVLSEQFVITHKVSDLLKVDKKNLIANAIRNHVLEKRLDDEDWYADYNYVKIDFPCLDIVVVVIRLLVDANKMRPNTIIYH